MNEYYKIFLSEQFLEFLRSTFFSWVRLIYSRLNYVIFINATVHSIESYEKYTGILKVGCIEKVIFNEFGQMHFYVNIRNQWKSD